jgi:hypothetical protein
MKPITTLVRVKHGSHLYGTSTPQSDQDFKSVHLPSGKGIIMQRAENVIDSRIKLSDTIKNQAGDIDDQSYSLQKFLTMVSAGDTVGTEILFAPPEAIVYSTPEWDRIRSYAPHFINRKAKGFVGYCQRQAAKYGIKGSRMAAVKSVLDFLEIVKLGLPLATARLSDIEPQLRTWSKGREYISWENIPNPNGSENWHLNVCDRKMPMTCRVEVAYDVWAKVWDNYGDRARAAMTNEGIDWKAISHAVRVARQAIELLGTGAITFPRPDADELLRLKLGQVPYAEVAPMLEDLVNEVNTMDSTLPESSDHEFIEALIEGMYKGQTR